MYQATDQYGLPWGFSGKESACQCGRCRFKPWVGKTPWRRKWQPTSVFLPGKSQGQSLMGYTPQGHKKIRELVTKQQLITMENTDINWTWPLPSRNSQTINCRDITDLNLQAAIIKVLRKETQKKIFHIFSNKIQNS